MNVLKPAEPQNNREVLNCQKSEINFLRHRNDLGPKLISDAGERAQYHFLEFFSSQIRNTNTREAYMRAIHQFCNWCSGTGLALHQVSPISSSAYIEGHSGTPATVKQHLAAIRMVLDFLVIRGVLPSNPTHSVKAPRESMRVGKTMCMQDEDLKVLFASVKTDTVVGLRDRALIGTMFYSFARVSAVLGMNVGDYFQNGKRYFIRLKEKGGKYHPLPVHHKLEEYLDAYLLCAKIQTEKKEPLFRTCSGINLASTRMSRDQVFKMVRRRCLDAGLGGEFGCHSSRASGITNYRKRGGTLEMAQQMAGHASADTTRLYDRSNEEVSLTEIERVQI